MKKRTERITSVDISDETKAAMVEVTKHLPGPWGEVAAQEFDSAALSELSEMLLSQVDDPSLPLKIRQTRAAKRGMMCQISCIQSRLKKIN